MTAANVPAIYAKALLDLAAERNEVPAVVAAARDLAEALSPAAIAQIDNPRVAKPIAKRLLRETVSAKAPRTMQDFLQLLFERNRLPDAPAILREAVRADAESVGRFQVQVVAAQPVAQDRLAHTIKVILGPNAEVTTTVDDRLIGGATVRLGDVLVDASAARHLKELTNRMHSAPLADKLWDSEGT